MKIIKNIQSHTTLLYYENVDIDGIKCRHEFSKLIKKTGHKSLYNYAHEWCCGHGAIGFQLLEDGICQHLILTDKYTPATQGCEFTVVANDLQNLVTIHNTNSLSEIPNDKKWDLFVANPPWRFEIKPGPEISDDNLRKMFDLDWQVHDDLWDNIDNYTTDDADIYIYEDSRFSNIDTWSEQIARANLEIFEVYQNFNLENAPSGYVMHLIKPR